MVVLSVIADFFVRFWHQIAVIMLSCVPIIESRYSIVICRGLFPEISVLEAVILTQIGAFLTALILLLLLKPVFAWMKTTRLFKGWVEKLESHGKKKGEKLEGKLNNSSTHTARVLASVIGVFVFVAVPLPGTGVWTGCLVATLLDIRFKYAYPAVCLGSVCATAIMLAFSSVFFNGVAL